MLRMMFGLLGVVLALFPEQVRERYEQLAIENPDACTPRASTAPAIRTEGLVFTVASLTGGRAYAWLMNLLGVAGGVALFFPKQSLQFSTTLAYEQPETIQWKDGFIAAVRGIGVLYLILAYNAFKRRLSS